MTNGPDFFDSHPMFVLDPASLEILDANRHAVEIYGYSKSEFSGMTLPDLAEDTEKLEDNRPAVAGSRLENIWTLRARDGTAVQIQFTSHDFNYNGKSARLAVAHDVTELMEKSEPGARGFPRIKNYLTNSPHAEIEWDENFVVKKWSKRAEQFFGWNEEEVYGDESFFENFIHPEEQEIALKKREQAIENRQVNYTVEGRNLTKEGNTLFCRWYNTMLYDQEGKLVSVYSLVHDVSDRRQSENLFRALSEESLVGVYLIQDNVFKYVNPRFAKIFHYAVEEIEEKLSPLDLAHPDDRDEVAENIEKRISGEITSLEYDFRCLTKDGQVIYVNVYGSRIQYMGEPAVIGTLVDVTDRKLSMEQFRESVESFEDLFDSISDGIYILNENCKFIEVNRGAQDTYGYSREDFIGNTPEFLAAPGKVDMDMTFRKIRKALEGEKQVLNWWAKRKNGEV
ncbi:MAG: PAS domain S-box protein, partial [Balneolaceae bacterium]|nr:PAS domain S-box protein [Balneolaceae bacterium]